MENHASWEAGTLNQYKTRPVTSHAPQTRAPASFSRRRTGSSWWGILAPRCAVEQGGTLPQTRTAHTAPFSVTSTTTDTRNHSNREDSSNRVSGGAKPPVSMAKATSQQQRSEIKGMVSTTKLNQHSGSSHSMAQHARCDVVQVGQCRADSNDAGAASRPTLVCDR